MKALENNRVYYLLLFAVFISAFLLRIYKIDSLDLWRDEAFSTILVQKDVSQIINITANATNPPLHPIVLHFWMKVFGTSELSIRFPSLLASFGSVVYLFFITKIFFKKREQLLITTLYTTSIVSIFYAREARAYGILIFTLTASVYYLLRLVKKFSFLDALAFVVFTTLSFYTHNLALFFIPCQIAYLFLKKVQKNKLKNFSKELRRNKVIVFKWLTTFGTTLILASPWLFISFTQAQKVEGSFWLGFDPTDSVNETLTGLATGIRLFHHEKFSIFDALLNWSTIVFLMLGTSYELFKIKKTKFAVTLFFWLPFIIVYFVSFKRPLLYVRYLSFLSPFMFVLLFKGIKGLFQNKSLQLLFVLIISLLSLNVYFSYLLPDRSSKAQYKNLTRHIEQNYHFKDFVINYDALSFFSTRFYLDETIPDNKIYDPKDQTPYYVGKALLEEEDFIRNISSVAKYDRLWIVELYGRSKRKFLEENYYMAEDLYFQGNLYLELWIKKDKQNFLAFSSQT